jgi:tryptophan synthase alpha chain
MNLKHPRLIGFGISDNATFRTACDYANGAIIGSAFINEISNTENISKNILNFVENIKINLH